MVETIAAQIVALIVPYLAQAGEIALESVAAKALDAIRKKFKGDNNAEDTLKQLEEKPDDEDQADIMRAVLKKKMRSDPQFASILEQLLKQIDQPAGDKINQKITIDRGSKVGRDITQIGKQENN